MQIRDRLKKQLFACGMTEEQADAVVELVIADPIHAGVKFRDE